MFWWLSIGSKIFLKFCKKYFLEKIINNKKIIVILTILKYSRLAKMKIIKTRQLNEMDAKKLKFCTLSVKNILNNGIKIIIPNKIIKIKI